MNKKFTKLIAALALLVFMTPSLAGWGQTRDDVTIQYSGSTTTNMTGNNDAATLGINASNWSVVGNKGGSSNLPGLNKDGTIRLYAGGTGNTGNGSYFTVTNSDGNTITNITMNVKSGTATILVDNQAVTGSNNIYSINSTSFKVQNQQSTGQVHINSITVTYSTGGSSTVSAPTFDPESGATFEESLSVKITPAANTTMYYTTDGSAPSSNTGTGYTTEQIVNLTATTTIKAIAYDGSSNASSVAEATYTKLVFDNIEDVTEYQEEYTVKGTVVATNSRGFVIGDGTGYVYYYKGSTPNQSVGDKVTITGPTATYGHILQFSSSTNPAAVIAEATSSDYNNTPAVTVVDDTAIATYNSDYQLSDYVQYEGTLTKTTSNNNTYYNIAVGTATARISYQTSGQATALEALLNKTVRVKGYFAGFSSNTFTTMMESVEEVQSTTPTITVSSLTLSNFTYEVSNGPSVAQTLTVSGVNLTDNISINISGNFEQSINGTDYSTGEITLQPDNDTVTERAVSIRLAADLAVGNNYTGTITLTSAGATSVTINLTGTVTAPEAPHVTWDLSTASYASATTTLVTWSSDYATMTNDKGESSTAANNYLGGGNNGSYVHTRFYQNQVLTIAPVVGYAIDSIKIKAVTSYVSGFTGNSWINATASANGTTVTVIPTNKNQAVSDTISGACRATEVKVYYKTSTIQNYELEIEAEHGTVTVAIGNQVQTGNGGSYQIPQGSTVTLTAAPAEGYRFVEWQAAAEDETVTVTIDENNQFTMPGCYVLVQAVFEAIPTYVYTYSINGVEGEYTEVQEGTVIQLAAGQNLNADFTFAGWTTNVSNVSTILSAGSDFTIDDNYEFYAVYAHTTTVGGTSGAKDGEASYVKVTSTSDITDGNYLIVTEGTNASNESYQVAFNGNLATLDASSNFINVEISEVGGVKTIAATGDAATAYFTIDVTNGFLKSASGKYIYQNSYANGLQATAYTEQEWNALTAAEIATLTNAFEIDNDGNAVISALGVSSTVNNETVYCTMRFNKASNQNRFRYYKSGQEDVQLYKYTTGGTPTPQPVTTTAYYTRVFLNETVSADIEIVGPSIIPSGQILDMGEDYILENDDAANLIIEDGGQLYTEIDVLATIQKNILAASNWGEQNPDDPYTPDGWYFISYPLLCDYTNGGDNPTGVTNLISSNNNYDLYLFDPTGVQFEQENGEGWVNYKAHTSDFKLLTGHGYLYANAGNLTLNFAGTVNLVDPDYPVSLEDGFNLVGNPFAYDAYPSVSYYKMNDAHTAITAELCDDAVPPCTGIIVDNRGGDISGITFSKNLSQVDDGVFNGNLQMTVTQQATNRGTSATIDNAIVSFNKGSKLGKFYFGTQNANIYFPMGTEDYAIVSADAQGEMPVNFKANESGTYTITVNPKNVEMNYLHLIDNMTGANVDLLQTPSYTFNANADDYAFRFRLLFAAKGINNAEGNDDFAFVSNGNLMILGIEGKATLQIVDVTGRILSSETFNGSFNKPISAKTGVYMLNLIQDENVRTQKIIVK